MPHYQNYLHDEAGTMALGAALARALEPGLAIHLHGDLGAGKTTLTRALLHAAGHAGHVKSPTYTLVEPYALAIAGRPLQLMHFDLYRMGSAEEFLDAGFREEFNEHNICIVEWPEKAGPVLPPPDIAVYLSLPDDGREGREVELHALSAKGTRCLDRLKFAPNL
jgi:tRNA threonylcarbamoyladenosine biosynthesis protein TsaE